MELNITFEFTYNHRLYNDYIINYIKENGFNFDANETENLKLSNNQIENSDLLNNEEVDFINQENSENKTINFFSANNSHKH